MFRMRPKQAQLPHLIKHRHQAATLAHVGRLLGQPGLLGPTPPPHIALAPGAYLALSATAKPATVIQCASSARSSEHFTACQPRPLRTTTLKVKSGLQQPQ